MATITYSWQLAALPFFMNDLLTTGSQTGPAVASFGGRYFGVWTTPQSTLELRGRVINADGTPVASEFPVNSTVAGNQSEPSVAILRNGTAVVTFTDTST